MGNKRPVQTDAVAPPPMGPIGPNAADAVHNGVDPELLALPLPPRAQRYASVTLMALAVALAFGLLISIHPDVTYFFSSQVVTDLGEATKVDPVVLEPNTFVRVHGIPLTAGAVRYSRFFSGHDYVVFPLAAQRSIFVQVPYHANLSEMARNEFTGRLVTFGDLGPRFGAVRRHLKNMNLPISSESWLLIADETPGTQPLPLFFALICLLVIVVNVGFMIRWFRPLSHH